MRTFAKEKSIRCNVLYTGKGFQNNFYPWFDRSKIYPVIVVRLTNGKIHIGFVGEKAGFIYPSGMYANRSWRIIDRRILVEKKGYYL